MGLQKFLNAATAMEQLGQNASALVRLSKLLVERGQIARDGILLAIEMASLVSVRIGLSLTESLFCQLIALIVAIGAITTSILIGGMERILGKEAKDIELRLTLCNVHQLMALFLMANVLRIRRSLLIPTETFPLMLERRLRRVTS